MESPEPSKYITLVSGDGFEFIVLREAALVSTMIKAQLNPTSMINIFLHSINKPKLLDSDFFLGNFQEALTGVCRFEEITYVIFLFPLSTLF
jgi:hypothetical protein